MVGSKKKGISQCNTHVNQERVSLELCGSNGKGHLRWQIWQIYYKWVTGNLLGGIPEETDQTHLLPVGNWTFVGRGEERIHGFSQTAKMSVLNNSDTNKRSITDF